MIIKKDSEIVKAKRERKYLALKAKKESSDAECPTSRSEDEEYAMVDRDFKKLFKKRGRAYTGGNVIFGSNLRGNIIGEDESRRAYRWEAMINSIKNGDQPLPRVTQVSIAGTSSTKQPPLKDKSMWKAAVLYEYETFNATEEELLLDTYIRYLQLINDLKKCGYSKDNHELNFKFLNNLQPEWKQYATMMRQNKNLIDINIDALYNILNKNQGDVNDAMGSKKKIVVITSDPLALIAEKTKVSKSKEKVVVSSDSEGSDVDDFSELKKITSFLPTSNKSLSRPITIKLKRKRCKRKSSKQNVKQVDNDVSRANSDFVHFSDLDTFSSVTRPKNSRVIWKKKRSSNTSNVGFSAVNVSNLNINVKRYSRKDLLVCNNSHLGETSSASVCNDAMNVSCNSRMCDFPDDNNLFIFDDESVKISPISKMPFRKKSCDSMNVRSKSNMNKSLPRTVHCPDLSLDHRFRMFKAYD
nr:RNA-directed DNA polymerase, eukaryota [Tanacetum cinerariifolium]